jgi:hypothetical protein
MKLYIATSIALVSAVVSSPVGSPVPSHVASGVSASPVVMHAPATVALFARSPVKRDRDGKLLPPFVRLPNGNVDPSSINFEGHQVYKKNSEPNRLDKLVGVRAATVGEQIQTWVIQGEGDEKVWYLETINTAKDGDMVVTNPTDAKEQILVSAEMFQIRYVQWTQQSAEATGGIKGEFLKSSDDLPSETMEHLAWLEKVAEFPEVEAYVPIGYNIMFQPRSGDMTIMPLWNWPQEGNNDAWLSTPCTPDGHILMKKDIYLVDNNSFKATFESYGSVVGQPFVE